MCPQPAQRRKWNHQPPLARHSTHPEPLGGIAGSMSMSVQHVDFWRRYLQIEHETLMTNIELYATRVIPYVRELPAQRPGAHA